MLFFISVFHFFLLWLRSLNFAKANLPPGEAWAPVLAQLSPCIPLGVLPMCSIKRPRTHAQLMPCVAKLILDRCRSLELDSLATAAKKWPSLSTLVVAFQVGLRALCGDLHVRCCAVRRGTLSPSPPVHRQSSAVRCSVGWYQLFHTPVSNSPRRSLITLPPAPLRELACRVLAVRPRAWGGHSNPSLGVAPARSSSSPSSLSPSPPCARSSIGLMWTQPASPP